jgi:hypothetical protein
LLRLQHVSLAQETDSRTMEALLECARSVKVFLEAFISSFEPMDYMGMSFNIWKQMSSSMFLVARLIGLSDPGWDVNSIRSVIYLPDIIEGFASKMVSLVDMVGWKSGGIENVYMRSTKMISLTKSWARSIYNTPEQAVLNEEEPTSLAAIWKEEEQRRWQQQHQQQQQQRQQQQSQQQQTAAVAAEEQEEVMATAQPMQMADGPMLPAFDQDIWSDDMFGLWDIYSGRGAFAFTE